MPKRKRTAVVAQTQPQSPMKMQKRMRRTKTICSCSSPRYSAASAFSWFEEDVWTEISKYLDGKSLVMLAATCRWFHGLIMEGSIWKYLCLRDLQVPSPSHVAYNWRKLYVSAFDGSHSYMFHQKEKHIDWMRIGAFSVESSEALLTERLSNPLKLPEVDTIQNMLDSCGCCVLANVKSGIWIADLQLVRCPVCELNTCDGTMQTLDARHIELFLNEGYQNGSWEYELIGCHDVNKHADGASGAIFDIKHLKDSSTTGKFRCSLHYFSRNPKLINFCIQNHMNKLPNEIAAVFNLNSWVGKPNNWQPKAVITLHSVAVNTNLQKNEGLQVKYHVMRAGAEGQVVSIRISQQLL